MSTAPAGAAPADSYSAVAGAAAGWPGPPPALWSVPPAIVLTSAPPAAQEPAAYTAGPTPERVEVVIAAPGVIGKAAPVFGNAQRFVPAGIAASRYSYTAKPRLSLLCTETPTALRYVQATVAPRLG